MKHPISRSLAAFVSLAAICLATKAVVAQPDEPAPTIPKPELPTPNGWDFIVKAAQSIHGGPGGTPSHMKEAKNPAADLALQRAYVAQNDEAFRLLREGFRYPSRQPRSDDPIPDLSINSRLRELARLLMQKSRVAVAGGKFDEAAEACLDAIQLGVVIARGANTVGALTGAAIEIMGRSELKALLPRLNAAQLRQAAMRLQNIEMARTSYADVLTEEKWSGLAFFQAYFREPLWQKFRANQLTDQEIKASLEWDDQTVAFMKKISDRQIQLNYLKAMDEAIAASRLPFAEQKDIELPRGDPLSKLAFGNSGQKTFRVSIERSATENALLIAQLALQAYRADHGHYPEALQALVPRYLQRVPLDPFDPAKPLRYRREANGYLLYSIGPDGVDDGGTPIDNKPPLVGAVTERTRRLVLPQSKGDVLADVPQ